MSEYKIQEQESLAIDYAKAIGIIAVVISHYPLDPFNIYLPYMYHMPLFFFLGGMLMRTKKSITVHILDISRKHLLYIAIVYIIIAITTSIIHYFYPINYTSMWQGSILYSITFPIKNNFHGGSYFLVAWFLFSYIFVSILSSIIIRAIKLLTNSNLYLITAIIGISITFGFVGMTLLASSYNSQKTLWYLNNLSQISVGLSFFLLGYSVRTFIFKYINIYGFAIGFIALHIIKELGLNQTMGMSWSRYPNGFLIHFISALIGIYSVLFFSKILSLTPKIKTLLGIGRNSRSIMSYHLLVFIFIDIIFFELGVFDITQASRFGHFESYYSWPIYITAGVFLPYIFSLLFSSLSRKTHH